MSATMSNPARLRTLLGVVIVLVGQGAPGEEGTKNWPQFRGPGASGVGAGGAAPTEWDVASGKNVKWKTPVPGLGYSCPVVWGDRVFVPTAVKQGDQQVRVGLYG